MSTPPRIGVKQSQQLKLTTGLFASITALRLDAGGLTRYLEEQAAENPALVLSQAKIMPGEWLPRWDTVLPGRGGMDPAFVPDSAPSLLAHVTAVIGAMTLSPAETRIALALVEGLEPSGWLGPSLASVAARLSVPESAVAVMLQRLQAIDPPGLFARNLAECLLLQARDAGADDALMQVILDHLPLMAAGDVDRLATLARTTPDRILACFRLIRSFNPKPGAQFAAHAAVAVREPDLIARREGASWVVALNRSALPDVQILPGRGGGQAAARATLRLVEARNATLLRVGQEILARQYGALDRGLSALLPLTMADIAAALGLHKSTISRVVAGASVDTPRGTWWLRSLFSGDMGGEGWSAAALRARIAELVASEPQGAPLGDDDIAAALQRAGAVIARRTVAKYREMLGIPAAHRRRRAFGDQKRRHRG